MMREDERGIKKEVQPPGFWVCVDIFLVEASAGKRLLEPGARYLKSMKR
jgi:hypothetical protein